MIHIIDFDYRELSAMTNRLHFLQIYYFIFSQIPTIIGKADEVC